LKKKKKRTQETRTNAAKERKKELHKKASEVPFDSKCLGINTRPTIKRKTKGGE